MCRRNHDLQGYANISDLSEFQRENERCVCCFQSTNNYLILFVGYCVIFPLLNLYEPAVLLNETVENQLNDQLKSTLCNVSVFSLSDSTFEEYWKIWFVRLGADHVNWSHTTCQNEVSFLSHNNMKCSFLCLMIILNNYFHLIVSGKH